MGADYNGYWKMISNENFEEYLKALGEFYTFKILNPASLFLICSNACF